MLQVRMNSQGDQQVAGCKRTCFTHAHTLRHTHTMDDLLDHVGKIQATQQKMQKGVGNGLDNLSQLLKQAKEAIATGEIMRA